MLMLKSHLSDALTCLSCLVVEVGVKAVGSVLFLEIGKEPERLGSQASVVIMREVALIKNKEMLCKIRNIWAVKFDFSLEVLQKKICVKKWQWARDDA